MANKAAMGIMDTVIMIKITIIIIIILDYRIGFFIFISYYIIASDSNFDSRSFKLYIYIYWCEYKFLDIIRVPIINTIYLMLRLFYIFENFLLTSILSTYILITQLEFLIGQVIGQHFQKDIWLIIYITNVTLIQCWYLNIISYLIFYLDQL